MDIQNEIKVCEDKEVRSVWDEKKEKWYFSIIDVIKILAGSPRPRKYWNALKIKLKAEGSQLSQSVGQLKMKSADGKFYLTDGADTEQLFRLIQSIPSLKAELFKRWLAQVASEQLDEMQDPEFSIDRALQRYLNLGYSENWINQRLTSIEIRNELTNQSQQANSEMGEMGKAALQNGKRKMANEKVQDKSNSFSALGIGSSVAHYYIRD
jgi:hypothetical protein